MSHSQTHDVIVIGAGFAGLYSVHKLRDQMGLDVTAFEAASGVGGTWFWNRYPGARCDIESIHYSYSFSEELQQEWNWSERYAGQPEILDYLNHVADRFDLRRNIQFNTRVTSMVWDEENSFWRVGTDDGKTTTARYVISGVGNLSVPKEPDFPGVQDFQGDVYVTGNWPQEPVDFTGKRVGVIGTGSSGIQAITEIAKQAGHLTVFQRTPNFATPIGNGPIDPELYADQKARYAELRKEACNHVQGVPLEAPLPSAIEVSEEKRREVYDKRYTQGGFRMFLSTFADIYHNKGIQRHRRRLHPREDPGARGGPGSRRTAQSHRPPLRRQAPRLRERLLRSLQPGQRGAGGRQVQPHRAGHRHRTEHHHRRVRIRRPGPGHRLRRHDRPPDGDGRCRQER